MSMPMTEARQVDAARAPARDEERWQAVKRRDPAFDGKFLFAVRTTGIYCRPSCASRPAKRENVTFFETGAQAEKAGYRACKRCRPDQLGAPDPQMQAVSQACKRIETAEEAPKLAELAASAGLSPYHFHRVFKALTGVTPKAYAAETRARRAANKLRTAETVTEAIYDAGFNSSSRFYENTDARLGMTPGAVRRGGAGAVIRFAVGEASLGAVLVAATDKGVCAILLGDDPDTLVRDLQDRFPNADFEGGDAEFERMVAASCRTGRGARSAIGSAARHPRHRVPATGLGGAERNSAGQDGDLHGDRPRHRPADRRARRRSGLRRQSTCDRDSVPSRGAFGRRPLRLSLGRRAQAQADRSGGGVMKARTPSAARAHFLEAAALAPTPLPGGEGLSGARTPSPPGEGGPR